MNLNSCYTILRWNNHNLLNFTVFTFGVFHPGLLKYRFQILTTQLWYKLFRIPKVEITFLFLWFRSPTNGWAVLRSTCRREVPGSILGRACRPSRSEFSVVFLRNSRKYGLGSLRKTPPPTEGIPPIGAGSLWDKIGLKTYNPTRHLHSFSG